MSCILVLCVCEKSKGNQSILVGKNGSFLLVHLICQQVNQQEYPPPHHTRLYGIFQMHLNHWEIHKLANIHITYTFLCEGRWQHIQKSSLVSSCRQGRPLRRVWIFTILHIFRGRGVIDIEQPHNTEIKYNLKHYNKQKCFDL